jgi:hypothetical protein
MVSTSSTNDHTVSLDDVRRLAAELFSQPELMAIVGPR